MKNCDIYWLAFGMPTKNAGNWFGELVGKEVSLRYHNGISLAGTFCGFDSEGVLVQADHHMHYVSWRALYFLRQEVE